MTMDVKTIREGGANDRAIRLANTISYANLTLKRGMTQDFGLWRWFERSARDPALRANAEIVLLAADGSTEWARFQVERCMPIKIKAPALSGKDGQIAVEELQIAYEKFQLAMPRQSP
jgi:phage tail-like protein